MLPSETGSTKRLQSDSFGDNGAAQPAAGARTGAGQAQTGCAGVTVIARLHATLPETVIAVGDTHRANIARTMGNLGGWSREHYAPDIVDHADEDFEPPVDDASRPSRLARWRGRAICWSLVAGVFLAYVNHWPGGN